MLDGIILKKNTGSHSSDERLEECEPMGQSLDPTARSGEVSYCDSRLSLELQRVLNDLVCGCNRPRVRLITALCDNHVGELGCEVDV